MRLKGKVVVVTGAGGGIGEGIAKSFAAQGALLVVCDIRGDCAETGSEQINLNGFNAISCKTDVTQSDQVENLVKLAVDKWGRLDIFINNAGWTHRNKSALEVTEEEFNRCFSVNMKSIYLSTIHAVPQMRKQGGGSFINIASVAGIRPRPGLTWYNGSKGAVITSSKSLAAEFGPDNIRVNCINSVFNPDTGLSTEFAGGLIDETIRARFLSTIPLGRFSTSDDVANAALYLASDEASFISGTCIEVYGARLV